MRAWDVTLPLLLLLLSVAVLADRHTAEQAAGPDMHQHHHADHPTHPDHPPNHSQKRMSIKAWPSGLQ